MTYEKQNFTDGQVLTAENLNRMEDAIATAATCITALEETGASGGGFAEEMELIKTITITEEDISSAVFDDNFCLKKFILKAYFAGVSGQTARSVTFSMMEKLDDGTYNVFRTTLLSAIVDNSARYFNIWGELNAGVPVMLYMTQLSQYAGAQAFVESLTTPDIVNKGLTRLFFADSAERNLPVGSTFELWGVRV